MDSIIFGLPLTTLPFCPLLHCASISSLQFRAFIFRFSVVFGSFGISRISRIGVTTSFGVGVVLRQVAVAGLTSISHPCRKISYANLFMPRNATARVLRIINLGIKLRRLQILWIHLYRNPTQCLWNVTLYKELCMLITLERSVADCKLVSNF